MLRTHTLATAPWPELTPQITASLGDAQYAQAGVWRLRHVAIALPIALAQAPQAAHLALRNWLRAQGLAYLMTGAPRHDVALHLDFEKIS